MQWGPPPHCITSVLRGAKLTVIARVKNLLTQSRGTYIRRARAHITGTPLATIGNDLEDGLADVYEPLETTNPRGPGVGGSHLTLTPVVRTLGYPPVQREGNVKCEPTPKRVAT